MTFARFSTRTARRHTPTAGALRTPASSGSHRYGDNALDLLTSIYPDSQKDSKLWTWFRLEAYWRSFARGLPVMVDRSHTAAGPGRAKKR